MVEIGRGIDPVRVRRAWKKVEANSAITGVSSYSDNETLERRNVAKAALEYPDAKIVRGRQDAVKRRRNLNVIKGEL